MNDFGSGGEIMSIWVWEIKGKGSQNRESGVKEEVDVREKERDVLLGLPYWFNMTELGISFINDSAFPRFDSGES